MLNRSDIIAFVATANPERAKSFYAGTLGLRLVDDSPFALEFDANGTMLRIQKVESVSPLQYTALGWRVGDIGAAVDDLTVKGIEFKRFDGMPQDERGVWHSPGGAKVAWFNDYDGNMLSLTELPAAPMASG